MSRQPKSVGEIGEFGLIARLRAICGNASHPDVVLGIGDDTAVLAGTAARLQLATCDIQVQDVHFRLDWLSPRELGGRAIAVNQSDVAAMGGVPEHALVSLALPGEFPVASFDQLFEGMRDQMAAHGGSIVGGNLASTRGPLVIDVFMMGSAAEGRVLCRSGARPGDAIFVTGSLGASATGIAVLRRFGSGFPTEHGPAVHAHRQPIPRVREAALLAETGAVTAMIDVSDGLAADLGHLCTASAVGAEIELARIPVAAQAAAGCAALGEDPEDMALHGGEDYELLFTVRPEAEAVVVAALRDLPTPLTRVGTVLPAEDGTVLVECDATRQPLLPRGWDHFRRPDE